MDADQVDLASVDLMDGGLHAEGPPHEVLERLRSECPVHQATYNGQRYWSFVGDAEVVEVSRDPQSFSSGRAGIFLNPDQVAPIDLLRKQGLNGLDLSLHVRRAHQDDVVAGGLQDLVDAIDDGHKERIFDLVKDQAHGGRLALDHAPRDRVWPILQAGDRLQYTLAHERTDVPVVAIEHMRNRRHRDSRMPGNLAHGYGFLAHISPLVKRFTKYTEKTTRLSRL